MDSVPDGEVAAERYEIRPIGSDDLLPKTPERELFDSFYDRVQTIPGFRQRNYEAARNDFSAAIIDPVEPDLLPPIEARRQLIQNVITKESYERYRDDTKDYWDKHNLEEELKTKTIVFVTNHRAFSDLPVAAVAVSDFRRHDRWAVLRNILVTGRLIPTMEVDLAGDSNYLPVVPLLQLAGRQAQTLPKLPDGATDEAKGLRKVWNGLTKRILNGVFRNPGNIAYVALSGSQDLPKGDKLIMQHINKETVKLLCQDDVLVVPLFFSCASFGKDGISAAEAKYQYFAPRQLRGVEDVREIMQEFAEAGSELLADEFPGGVHYEKDFRDRSVLVRTRVAAWIGKRATSLAQRWGKAA